jgi:hypothetical protein
MIDDLTIVQPRDLEKPGPPASCQQARARTARAGEGRR